MSQLTVQHIEQSIQKALRGESNLTEAELSIRGFSTNTMRHLWNNLCNTENPLVYLEIGLYCGATFCSSFNKNTVSVGVENYSQDFGVNSVKEELNNNIITLGEKASAVKFYDLDCFNMVNQMPLIPDNVGIYFYDGNHKQDFQAKALSLFLDKMANKFIFIVDDFNWAEVFNGTNMGFEELKDKIDIEYCQVLRGYSLQDDPIYHNGLAIYLINKK